ncbi:MAG TPA: NAD(P)/FAD-dependent oxidoreductase [Candidatus Eisenbacteria bacterium]|nr:NAD(P)/FAD-dependent oxidoreductase [Candidatus Eisenbacteria bacterium]
MAKTRDVVIVGGGHNGLIAAFYLAKAGFRPLVLERMSHVGGCAITEEFHPGFRCSTLAHATGPMRPEVVSDMNLASHGLETYTPDVRVLSLSSDGSPLALYSDTGRTQQEIAKYSTKEAANYFELQKALANIAAVVDQLLHMTPPDIDEPASGNVWELLKTGRKIRGLDEKDFYRLFRWMPMAAADLVAEWFDTELLRATLAAQGIFGTFLGPWSAGSGATLLLRAAADGNPAGGASYVMGGTGALTTAMAIAAQAAGAEIRTNVEVTQIKIKDGSVAGVVLSNGDEIDTRAVISSADPKRTLLGFVDPQHLAPSFLQRLQHYRMYGTVAKVNLALSGLPSFKGVDGNAASLLGGRIQVSPEIDYLERAFDASKYGEFSQHPYLEATIPTLHDPSLAPAGKHVMSIYMQYAPYKLRNADWDSQRDAFGDVVVHTLAEYAPDLPGKIEARQIITPKDLEQTYGLTGGHIFHGELALDQLFTMRPLLDWAQYRTPIKGLYLCGSGTHPGNGLTGGSGANAAWEIAKDLRKR